MLLYGRQKTLSFNRSYVNCTDVPCQAYYIIIHVPVQLAPRIALAKAACERMGMTCHTPHQCQRTRHHQFAPSGTPDEHCEIYQGAKWLQGICMFVLTFKEREREI